MCHWDPADSALFIFFLEALPKKIGYLSGIHVFQYTNIGSSMEHITAWWFGTMGILWTFHSVGNVRPLVPCFMVTVPVSTGASQLTSCHIFQSGRSTTNQL